jgi:para-nitrobenzyl esterase
LLTANTRFMRAVATGWLIGLLVLSPAFAGPPVVETDAGLLSGVVENDLAVFRGIPYTAPPVGEWRWRPPQRVAPWQGVRPATQFGPVCPQPVRYGQWGADHVHAVGMDEDCLSLNIWAPANRGDELLPVMFYMHGGNMQFGAGSLPVHDGGILAAEGVVLVNINYRINFLGRFAHPALTRLQSGEPLVNYGVMDQIAALEWVQRNIRAFGGDPDNVTIFGHSAGGVSVNFLMVAPASEGLFHKAIAQGSGVSLDLNRDAYKKGIPGAMEPSQEDVGVDLAEYFKISGTDEEVAQALRDLSTDDILEFHATGKISFNPAVDGIVIPDHIAKMFERGEQHDVPYLAGANSWEWSQIAGVPLIGKWFMAGQFLEGLSDEDLAVFDDQWTRIGVSQRWFSEGLFLTSTRYLARQMGNVSSPAYLYYTTYVQTNLRGQVPGTAHGVEMPFVFGNVVEHPEFNRPEVVELTAEDLAWGDTVRAYWLSFAKTGNPNGPGRPKWPAYEADTDLTMVLGDEFRPVAGLNAETLDYLEMRALVRRAEFEDSD